MDSQSPEVQIDPEIAGLIPPITEEERQQLASSIAAEGCRDSLVVLKSHHILLDGHHRLQICRQLGKPYTITELDLPDRNAALRWVILNQLGRRNLTSFQRAELALPLERVFADQAKKNQRAGGARAVGGGRVLRQKSAKPVDTKVEIARIAGISHDTLRKVKVIIEKAPKETIEKLRGGDTAIHHEYQRLIKKPKPKSPALGASSASTALISGFLFDAPSSPQATEQLCEVPGCDASAFMMVKRCALHLDDSTDEGDPWNQYQRHVAAAKHLLEQIPKEKASTARTLAVEVVRIATKLARQFSQDSTKMSRSE